MDEIYLYFVSMPEGVQEYITPCADGYTIYIDEKLDELHRAEAYQHALEHVRGTDFELYDVQSIEYRSHRSKQK